MARSKNKKKKRARKEYDGSPRNMQETIEALGGAANAASRAFGGGKAKDDSITGNDEGVLIDLPGIYRHLTDKGRIEAEKTAKLQKEQQVLSEQLKQATIKRQNEELKKQLEALKAEEQKSLPAGEASQ